MKRLAARRIRSGTISIGDVSLFVEVVGHGYSWIWCGEPGPPNVPQASQGRSRPCVGDADPEIERYLAFRDRLRQSPEDRAAYERVKRDLAHEPGPTSTSTPRPRAS